jgi:hypothetical protein
MHRLNRMSGRSFNSVSCLMRWQGVLKAISLGDLRRVQTLAGGPKTAGGDNDSLYWRLLGTEQLHGVRAEIVETILNGIAKREARYDTTLYPY